MIFSNKHKITNPIQDIVEDALFKPKYMKTKTTRVRKVPIKSFTAEKNSFLAPHTNFTDEISTDKFLDRTFYTIVSIVVILGIISLIVNLTR